MNTVADLGKAVKLKYPGVYDDLGDAVLGQLMKQKFPGSYNDFADIEDTLSIGQAQGISKPPGIMNQMVNVAKATAKMIPEAAGSLLGGLGGAALGTGAGPVGMFAGGAAGAGVGAAGGKALEVGLLSRMFPSIYGKPQNMQSAVSSIANSGNMGMMAEAGGRGLQTALPMVLKRALPSQAIRDVATMEREGIPYTAGDVRPGGAAQILENLTRGTLLGGQVMSEFDVAQAVKLQIFKEKFLNNVGPLFSKEEAGKLIQGSVEKRAQQLFGENGLFAQSYKKIASLYPVMIDTAKIRGEAQPLLKEVSELVKEGRIPAANSPENPSKFIAILKNLSTYGTRKTPKGIVDQPITYIDVWKDKQTIQAMLRDMGDDSLRTRAKATLKQIENILDTAMEEAAAKSDPKAARLVKSINASYREAKQLMETESIVADMRNGRYDPEQIVNRFFEGDRITPAKDLLRAIPPGEKAKMLPVIRRRTLENLFEKASLRIQEANINSVKGKVLDAVIGKDRAVLETLLTPEQMVGLEDFINAAQRAQKSGAMTNPASGRQMLALSQAGNVLQITGAGLQLLTGQPVGDKLATETAMIIGPKFLAHAVTNPAIAKLLAKGFSMSPQTARSIGWTPRMMNILRMFNEANGEPEQK